ncbi:hypothetical protein AAG906_022133 [Vitis piasezkii]
MAPRWNRRGYWRGYREETAKIPEMEPAKALEIAQSSQWVLSFQPLVSFAVADLLTWLAGSGTGSFRRLFLRFEGDEDLAPLVRAISGCRNLAEVADRRR